MLPGINKDNTIINHHHPEFFFFQVVSGIFYVSTYEGVRHILDKNGVQDPRVKAMLGGSCASMGECSDHQMSR